MNHEDGRDISPTAIEAAEDLVHRRIIKEVSKPLLITIMLSLVILANYILMSILAVSALSGFTAGASLLAEAYLFALAGLTFGQFLQVGWRLSKPFPRGTQSLPATWQSAALTMLDGRDRWRARATTAPLAVLVTVRLVQLQMSITSATLIAIASWVATDVVLVINSPARFHLDRSVELIKPLDRPAR